MFYNLLVGYGFQFFSYFNGLFDAGMAFTFLPRGRAISARYIIDKTYFGSLSDALGGLEG